MGLLLPMPEMQFKVRPALKHAAEKHSEVDWDAVVNEAIRVRLARLEAGDRRAVRSPLNPDQARRMARDARNAVGDRLADA